MDKFAEKVSFIWAVADLIRDQFRRGKGPSRNNCVAPRTPRRPPGKARFRRHIQDLSRKRNAARRDGSAAECRSCFWTGPEYQDVILPFTVLRRIDCVLDPTRERVRKVNAKLQAKGLQNREPQLRKASGYAFYNTSLYEFDSLREVRPHVPDAWVNTAVRDPKDGEVGRVGYEINFNRYFYKFQPPRPLEEIEADIRAVEEEILSMLAEVAG